ncbi:MAG: hypothetical protein QMD71_01255 [bacterium]|nr:hypothetical protein [bacterium]
MVKEDVVRKIKVFIKILEKEGVKVKNLSLWLLCTRQHYVSQ